MIKKPALSAPATNSEINAAKEKAVGGKRKRCIKGKSCSATCIQGVKECLVELTAAMSSSLSKAREKILNSLSRPTSQPNAAQIAPTPQPKIIPRTRALPMAFGRALSRFRSIIRNFIANTKDKNLDPGIVEPVKRPKPSASMTVHKHGDVLAPAVRKAKDNNRLLLDRFVSLGNKDIISMGGTKEENNVKWDAIEGSGARILGQGGYGSFLTVPTKKLLGDVENTPDNTGVKTGNIGRSEPFFLKKLGEQDLGPRLIAAKLVRRPHSNNDAGTVHKGVIAMEIVPGTPLYKSPEIINGKHKSDIFWSSMGKLHKLGIAHNDAKGDNFIIDEKGVGRFVDLGLAQKNWKAALSEAIGGWSGANFQATEPMLIDRVLAISNNYGALKSQMRKDGFTDSDIKTFSSFGIQRTLEEYDDDASWAKMDNRMAKKYIDIFYQGVD